MSKPSKSRTRKHRTTRSRKPLPLRLEHLEDRAVPTAYVVDTTDDGFVADGKTSLREALFAATLNKVTTDAAAGSPTDPDEITFNLGGSDTISLSKFGNLPIIASNSGPLSILGPTSGSMTLFGGKTVSYGLNVDGQTGVVIRNLIMTGFADAAVRVIDGGSATVQGCDILVNDGYGVLLDGATNCLIGGTTADTGNTISANGIDGVRITGAGATGNTIAGNYIGLNGGTAGVGVHILGGATGNSVGLAKTGGGNTIVDSEDQGVLIEGEGTDGNAVLGNWIGLTESGAVFPNGAAGVEVTGGAAKNQIGGITPGAGNVIGGNLGAGIQVVGEGTTGTAIARNLIGTSPDGREARPNLVGVVILGASKTTVGGPAAAAGNVISGNTGDGVQIWLDQAKGNVVAGNRIGTTADGTKALPNKVGVHLFFGAANNVIGLGKFDGGNVISGNTEQGVLIEGEGTVGNVVLGNRIGLDVNGAALPNGSGVQVGAKAANTVIGGSSADQRNYIGGNGGAGVTVHGVGTTGTLIAGNYIGTDPTGTEARPNDTGVLIFGGASGTLVGGSFTQGFGNLISGNVDDGVDIADSGTTGNALAGNLIGTTADGLTALPNGQAGVWIFFGATDNLVGLAMAGGGNVIAGNQYQGVLISRAGTNGNTLFGNWIGLNVNGLALANQTEGVEVRGGAADTRIGGPNASERNVISGNGETGVLVTGAGTTGTLIQGNSIGTDPTGTEARPNKYGVMIEEATATLVGGRSDQGLGNLISGNSNVGVILRDTQQNTVAGNLIGTTADGSAALGAQRYGVTLGAAIDNTVGGSAPGLGNVISGHAEYGVYIADFLGGEARGNRLEGNRIGTDKSGTRAVPNLDGGVWITDGASLNFVGGMTATPGTGAGNVISGNGGDGVLVNNLAEGNHVLGNLIGLGVDGQALGNVGRGVYVANGARDNRVGGEDAGAGNRIAHNAEEGVEVSDAATQGNRILGNAIHSNGQIGIDLGGDGVTPNDPSDADASPNGLQNFPVLATVAGDGLGTTVTGSLNSTADSTFRVEFFANSRLTGLDGETYLGFVEVTTDGSGNATFNATGLAPLPVGTLSVTATATNQATGDTSEFAQALVLNTPPAITDVTDQAVFAGQSSGPLSFTVSDAQTAPDLLTVTATSSDPTLIPSSGIVLGGTGADRTVIVTPAAGLTGTATITLTVTDAQGAIATDTFTVTVLPVDPNNTPPTITDVTDRTIAAGQSTGPLPFTVGDLESGPADLVVTVFSSDPALVPTSGIVLGGTGASRTVTVTPAGGLTGTATITLTVTDPGGGSVSDTFTVTVVPPGTVPPTPPPRPRRPRRLCRPRRRRRASSGSPSGPGPAAPRPSRTTPAAGQQPSH